MTSITSSASPRNPHRSIQELSARLHVARIEVGLTAHLLAVALLDKAGARPAKGVRS